MQETQHLDDPPPGETITQHMFGCCDLSVGGGGDTDPDTGLANIAVVLESDDGESLPLPMTLQINSIALLNSQGNPDSVNCPMPSPGPSFSTAVAESPEPPVASGQSSRADANTPGPTIRWVPSVGVGFEVPIVPSTTGCYYDVDVTATSKGNSQSVHEYFSLAPGPFPDDADILPHSNGSWDH